MAQATEWKSRYEATVRAQSQREATWLETESMLRRAIRRLAIAGRGRDGELDQHLNEVQRLSQAKRDRELDKALDRMAQRVIKLVESGEATKSAASAGLISASIVDLVKLLHLDEMQKKRVAKQVDEAGNLDAPSIERLAADINQRLAAASTPAAPANANPPAQTSADLTTEDAGDEDDTIESVMMTLVSRLSLLQGFGAGKIRARIVAHISRGDWHVAIDETIDAVSRLLNTLDTEKHDLESFIVGLTRELGAITRSIEADDADTDDNRRDTEALNELVRDGVANIEKDVSTANDINIIKSAIANNITQIRSGVDDYVGQLQQRYQASSDRNGELSERMKQMESETENLQRQLDENRKQLLTDALTGAHSRLAYDQAMEQALYEWNEERRSFAYAILDIDHFKNVNDTYGHSAGDRALQLVARLIRESLEGDDTVYRLGGEEFVLLFPGTSAAEADKVVLKARTAISGCRFHFKQNEVRLTLSAGITESRDGDSIESIYQRADKSLYAAKESGRNAQIIAD